jgi:hypothetical protein
MLGEPKMNSKITKRIMLTLARDCGRRWGIGVRLP